MDSVARLEVKTIEDNALSSTAKDVGKQRPCCDIQVNVVSVVKRCETALVGCLWTAGWFHGLLYTHTYAQNVHTDMSYMELLITPPEPLVLL